MAFGSLGCLVFFLSNRINNLVKICRLLEGRNSSYSVLKEINEEWHENVFKSMMIVVKTP